MWRESKNRTGCSCWATRGAKKCEKREARRVRVEYSAVTKSGDMCVECDMWRDAIDVLSSIRV
jgi:hypothetical protein